MTTTAQATLSDYFQRSLAAHLPIEDFRKLKRATILVAGLGGGSNIAELLVRKGIGTIIIADMDVYEPHNIRQRCSMVSTQGKAKVLATQERLLDVHPFVNVIPVPEGITISNAEDLVKQSDIVVDMMDLHAISEKIVLHRLCKKHNKIALTAPSVVNGAVLWAFQPDGISFEQFFNIEDGLPLNELAGRMLSRAIPNYPPEAPEEMYQAAARGERALPLDGVGVELAAVMTVGAVENLLLGREERVLFAPKGIQADLSNPASLVSVIDYANEFGEQA